MATTEYYIYFKSFIKMNHVQIIFIKDNFRKNVLFLIISITNLNSFVNK